MSAPRVYGTVVYILALVGILMSLLGFIMVAMDNNGGLKCAVNRILSGEAPSIVRTCMGSYWPFAVATVNVDNIPIVMLNMGLVIFYTAVTVGLLASTIMLLRGKDVRLSILAMAILAIIIMAALGLVKVGA